MGQQPAPLPQFSELSDSLHKVDPHSHASQLHGLICGFICTKGQDLNTLWKLVFPNAQINPDFFELLRELYDRSLQLLNNFSFEFDLLLPEEDIDINIRAESLGLWCQGFLIGLKQGGFIIENRPDDDVTEAMNDLTEISKISFGDITDDNEDEMAYMELVEYVRLSAVMIFQDLNSDETKQDDKKDDVLH